MRIDRLLPFVTALIAAAMLAGCNDPAAPRPVEVPAATPAATEAPPTDKWLGQWNGPEGTSLKLAGGQGQYDLTIQNLDGPRSFKGKAAGDRIEFERGGVKETIHATDGAQTGMKWLADKKDCLTVRAGEGYCRD